MGRGAGNELHSQKANRASRFLIFALKGQSLQKHGWEVLFWSRGAEDGSRLGRQARQRWSQRRGAGMRDHLSGGANAGQ